MSIGMYPEFEPKLAGDRFNAPGEYLAENAEALDRVARRAGLTPVTAFADNRPVPDDFDGDPDDLAAALGPWDEWFAPAAGRAAVEALAGHLRADPKAAGRVDQPDAVLDELDELARVLGVAAAQGVKFRLGVG